MKTIHKYFGTILVFTFVLAQVNSQEIICSGNNGNEQSENNFDEQIDVNALNNLIQSGENLAVAYDKRGVYYTKTSEFENAVADFKKSLEVDPNNAEALNHMGIVYYMLEDFSSSLKYYDKAIELNPMFGKAYFNRGITKFKMNDEEGGFYDMKKASKLKNQAAKEFLSENLRGYQPFGI